MAGLILSLTKAKVEPVTVTQLGENHKVTGLGLVSGSTNQRLKKETGQG
jgi:hypothetical protein